MFPEGNVSVEMKNVHSVHVPELSGKSSCDVVFRIGSRVGGFEHPVGDRRLVNILNAFLGLGIIFADADKHVQCVMIAADILNIAVFFRFGV